MSITLRCYVSKETDPYRNLAMEKRLLELAQPDECILYLWQNKNTVVIGRNQNAWAECRTELLSREGGSLARRLSGGGAVFHDLGNLNFTFVMCEEHYDLAKQLSVIQAACADCGISTSLSGRNDILAEGYKFSGNAFYHHGGKAYHHGTILIDVDVEKLGRYLSPPKAKLEAKGISSVRSRVINLKQLQPTLTCETMKAHMQVAFAQVYGAEVTPLALTAEDLQIIENYAREFSQWQWLYGQRLPFQFSCQAQFAWGNIQLQFQVEGGHIAAAKVYTDAMNSELAYILENALSGCPLSLEQLRQRLDGCVLVAVGLGIAVPVLLRHRRAVRHALRQPSGSAGAVCHDPVRQSAGLLDGIHDL